MIFDQHEIIRSAEINERNFDFEENGNYILVGLRRSGKSTLLYKIVQDLIQNGIDWNQIIYVNFEDERLSEFKVSDFESITEVQAELSERKGYFFFDEIQNIDGWEKFARRMSDAKERVYITGSNAKMLSREMERVLGGRYFSKYITPYSFKEYLNANGLRVDENVFYQKKSLAKIHAVFDTYLNFGGFPESLLYRNKREYVSSIYQKILLGDIVSRNEIRNEQGIRLMMKKIAESVREPLSYTKLHNLLNSIGIKISKDTIIDYVSYAQDAYLLYRVENYYSKFVEKETTPRYYFSDNGLLNLFLVDKSSILLENLIAVYLIEKYKEDVYYLKSSKTKIDVDFYIPSEHLAIQVIYELSETSNDREINHLLRLHVNSSEIQKLMIITYDEEKIIQQDGVEIQVIPAYKFLLQ